MQPLVIVGAGGFGRETAGLVAEINRTAPVWQLLGFLDDNPEALAAYPDHGSVLGSPSSYAGLGRPFAVCAVGDPGLRKQLVERLDSQSARWATLIDPTARIGTGSTVGEGCLLCAYSIVTADVRLGRHVHLNLKSSAGHDSRLADFCTLSPGSDVCGGAVLEEGVFLGSHACVLPSARVETFARVGAGSVVLRHLRAGATALGVPAREVLPPAV